MNTIWTKRDGEKINFDVYENKEDIFEMQRNNPEKVYIALLFDDDPIQNNSIRLTLFVEIFNNTYNMYSNHNIVLIVKYCILNKTLVIII